jgi:hypothetical protein
VTYDYLQNDVFLSANQTVSYTNVSVSDHTACTLPAFTPASGYSVYQVDYTYNATYNLTQGGFFSFAKLVNDFTGATIANSPASGSIAVTNTQSSYIQTRSPFGLFLTKSSSGTCFGTRTILTSSFARIFTRKPQANSTTPANSHTLVSYFSTLAGVTTLASGSLNYTAIL